MFLCIYLSTIIITVLYIILLQLTKNYLVFVNVSFQFVSLVLDKHQQRSAINANPTRVNMYSPTSLKIFAGSSIHVAIKKWLHLLYIEQCEKSLELEIGNFWKIENR